MLVILSPARSTSALLLICSVTIGMSAQTNTDRPARTSGVSAPSPSVSLTRDWQIDLGRDGLDDPEVKIRFGVCPRGGVAHVNALGRVAYVDPTGSIVLDGVYEETRGATAVACGEGGRLIVATRNLSVTSMVDPASAMLVVGEPDRLGRYTFSRVPLALKGFVNAIEPGSPGEAFLLIRPDTDGPFLHRVLLSGQAIQSFGSLPFVRDAFTDTQVFGFASLIWLRSRQELAFVPASPYLMQRYSLAGELLRTYRRKGPGFRPYGRESATSIPVGDRLNKVVVLPNGDFVSDVTREMNGGGGYLEWLGPALEIKATNLSYDGLLQGSDEQGYLYFSRVTRADGVRLIKARLNLP